MAKKYDEATVEAQQVGTGVKAVDQEFKEFFKAMKETMDTELSKLYKELRKDQRQQLKAALQVAATDPSNKHILNYKNNDQLKSAAKELVGLVNPANEVNKMNKEMQKDLAAEARKILTKKEILVENPEPSQKTPRMGGRS